MSVQILRTSLWVWIVWILQFEYNASIIIDKQLIHFSSEVQNAMNNGLPLVALESTIITHGMAYPANLDTAIKVEEQVRTSGAVPATIAILDGEIHVGLNNSALEKLAVYGQDRAMKVSVREVGLAIARRVWGGTTVSATSHIASAVGIRVFVTGGIGGVHRGAEESFDISSDLIQLAATANLAVVCAGAKSILDIPKTLEYLETFRVPVIGFQTEVFPGFYTAHTTSRVPISATSVAELAALYSSHVRAGVETSVLVVNPIPPQSDLRQFVDIDAAIATALTEAGEQGIAGKKVTPFLLAKIANLTHGKSLAANIALILNNARLGAELALALTSPAPGPAPRPLAESGTHSHMAIAVIGAAVVDLGGRSAAPFLAADSNPGTIRQSCGGVGRNVAEAIARLTRHTAAVHFYSLVGADPRAEFLLHSCLLSVPMRVDHVGRGPAQTATYLSIVDADGALVGAVADMAINQHIASHAAAELRANPPPHLKWIVLDGNLDVSGLEQVLGVASSTGAKLAFVPASVPKLLALKAVGFAFGKLSLFIGNAGEVEALVGGVEASGAEARLRGLGELFTGRYPGPAVVVTSRDGLCHCSPTCRYFPTPKLVERPVSVIGAGDSFAGGFIAGTALGLEQEQAVALGQQAARFSVECEETVSPKLVPLLH